MIVRPGELRRLLRQRGAAQIGEDALVVLAAALEDQARRFAEQSVVALEERNAARDVQRIPRLKRLTVADVEKAIGRLNGNKD